MFLRQSRHISPRSPGILHIFFFFLCFLTWSYLPGDIEAKKATTKKERIIVIMKELLKFYHSPQWVKMELQSNQNPQQQEINSAKKKLILLILPPPLPPLEYFWCKILNIFSIKSWTALGNGGMVERVKALANSRFRWIIIPVHLDSLLSAIHIVSYWTKRKQIRHDKDLNYCPNKKKIIR